MHADHATPPGAAHPSRKGAMNDFKPLTTSSQPYDDVLFINAAAPAAHLFEAANQRMAALGDLLQILESGSRGDVLAQETARLASALGLLLADAQTLHEVAFQRAREEQRPDPADVQA
ncbi:hypothetical protein [Pseudomonas sp. Q1-7]|uniref:hypothetical protein n=1 Tax=Pseudomonas sp. Q1-7 TaxID=3020843 RepID=UPI00230126F2|nr:hypothetical protein [Pseudomonas sp. Q1-7]